MRESAIVHFTAVMGIQRHALAFKAAYTYTPICSALIWVGRLLLLEHALPLHLYKTLGDNCLPQQIYEDRMKRFEDIRLKHMLRGGFYALGECIELRSVGVSRYHNCKANPMTQKNDLEIVIFYYYHVPHYIYCYLARLWVRGIPPRNLWAGICYLGQDPISAKTLIVFRQVKIIMKHHVACRQSFTNIL